ncbi:VPS10 domain-containing protein [Flavivirga spongiicola]|uniref:Glycosyl hydrolase n=1 Tax=Flavivirga spongiicola TaxID=421621 RepID=A0ABU7XXW4_9FLAO|nr:glycosyl hydrolase [Flavivirga sp. MEBiC05379]MDO5980633.1 glycosyl hydrolase [Flavivirga sp. MEBiC05379]
MRTKYIIVAFLLAFFVTHFNHAQKRNKEKQQPLDAINLQGLKWRNIGPAVNSGRISEIAVNPNNPFEYYVATASGGVWKTVNAGVDYQPIFDSQGSYSIGYVVIDPNNSNVIWVGTGENNNQRSVAYGDGVYKSTDGGQSWENMGLKSSEHIGKIIVDPNDSNIVYVAAIGPLWSKGGERGLYKTTDGGSTWHRVLHVDEHTGVSDMVMDPRDSNVIYATTHQRRRHVYTYVSGGPGSGIHKSVDGGTTWEKINKGLPDVELGRIGLSISQSNPEILYAIVEASNKKGGFYRSTNRGSSWEKRSSYVTSGNYYQEIMTDPLDSETIYAMDTWLHVSHDGGKSFKKTGEVYKHVDNHSIWIDPTNTKHWLVGTDGGIFETFDAAKHWDFKENLPITQFYKVSVDNDAPFYNVYGGTQDNSTLGGPSRVITNHGITNQDWIIPTGGDGFETQIDPSNPNIVYSQSQYGGLVRYDKISGEQLGIKPTERENENQYTWNWDAPLVISTHNPKRLYFAANKVFKSDDYGNSWEVISDDLTRQLDRNTLRVYDRVVSIDAVAKNASTSIYGSVVALSESPLDENLLIAGTDDGLIQITNNGGQSWKRIDHIPGAPKQSYINNVYLSQHDKNVIYVAFNHHKYGDFKPYIFKSNDQGNTWKSISNNLPVRGSVYAIEEDHVDKNLIFCGTEFGVYFSPSSGARWKKLETGLPTIAVRDIAIQRRENDLVLGTFGRGFYILDDYTSLRHIENTEQQETAIIYPIRDALMWEESNPLGLSEKSFNGHNFFSAENLGPELTLTYFYKDTYKSLKEVRQEKEKELIKGLNDTPYPSYETLKAEENEIAPKLVFIIKDEAGNVVKKILKGPKKGVQRLQWDLRYDYDKPIDLNQSNDYNPWAGKKIATLVNPGTYSVEMHLLSDGDMSLLVAPQSFKVKALNNTVLPAADRSAKVAFQREVNALHTEMSISGDKINQITNKLKHIKEAIKIADYPIDKLTKSVLNIEGQLKEIRISLYGDPLKTRLDIDQKLPTSSRLGAIAYQQKYSTSSPTKTHLNSFKIAKSQFAGIKAKVDTLYEVDIKTLEKLLKEVGAPYTPGRLMESPKN